MYMKLAFTTFNVARNLDLGQCIEVAKKSGCAGIEYRIDVNHVHGIELSLTAEQRKTALREHQENYLEVASITTGCKFEYADKGLLRENIERAMRVVDLAADLNCGRIRVFGNDIPSGSDPVSTVAQVGESLSEIADYALPKNVDILLEMHGQFNFWGYALSAVKLANRPNVGINYNCDNRDIVGGSILETFSRVKNYVRHIHAHEFGSQYPYQQLFAILAGMDYQGYISAELDGESASEPQYVMGLYGACFRAYRTMALAGFINI